MTMQIETDAHLSDVIVEIGIATPLGTSIYSTSSMLLGATGITVDGVSRFQVHLDSLQLGEGEYSVQVGLTTASGQEIHRVPEAGQFSIDGDGRSLGVVHVDAQFAVL